jgi:hypothetical protein
MKKKKVNTIKDNKIPYKLVYIKVYFNKPSGVQQVSKVGKYFSASKIKLY